MSIPQLVWVLHWRADLVAFAHFLKPYNFYFNKKKSKQIFTYYVAYTLFTSSLD